MSTIIETKKKLRDGGFDRLFEELYGKGQVSAQVDRYIHALDSFMETFSYGEETEVSLYSAPGRTEVGGNHTDHQHGRVLAAAVHMDVIAVAVKTPGQISVKSQGFPQDDVCLDNLEPLEEEKNSAASLIRGVCARFGQLDYSYGGFTAYTTSNVLKGSGLSSSAAFEVLLGTVLNYEYNEGRISPVEIAQISQYAENVYFGKPSGLMDQMASSVGNFVAIDFEDTDKPVIEKVEFDFAHSGYALCIVDTGGNHADLTEEYAKITREMKAVAARFGKEVLREVPQEEFYARISELRKTCGDRAVLRGIHFYDDNRRAHEEALALREGNFGGFLETVNRSGHSSFMYLQNVFAPQSVEEQGLSLALALSERILNGKGACRVHGGGFAGTIQAFVPLELLETYQKEMNAVFGENACHVLSIRPYGGISVSRLNEGSK